MRPRERRNALPTIMWKKIPEASSRGGLASHAGPRDFNEDSAIINDYAAGAGCGRYLCLGAVADGVGGQKAGETASGIAVELLCRACEESAAGRDDEPAPPGKDLLFEACYCGGFSPKTPQASLHGQRDRQKSRGAFPRTRAVTSSTVILPP